MPLVTPAARMAEAHLAVSRHRDRIGAGAGKAGEDDLIEAQAAELVEDLAVIRHVIFAVDEAPKLEQRIDRQIQRAGALLVDLLGGREHVGDLAGHNHVFPVGVIDSPNGAAFLLGVEHGVHGINHALGGCDSAVAVFAVGDKRHGRVHGEEDRSALFRLAAGGKRKHQQRTEQCAHNPRHSVCSLHKILLYRGKSVFFSAPRGRDRSFISVL